MKRTLLALSICCALATPARADSFWRTRPESPYVLTLELDLSLLLIALPGYLLTASIQNSLPPPACGQPGHLCDMSAVPFFDKPFMYYHPSLRTTADVLFKWFPLAAAGLLFLDYGPFRVGSYFTDLAIILESMAWTGLLTHIVRFALKRPRPYLYFDNQYVDQRGGADASSSFWSGHVAELMAFAVSTSWIFMLRHKHSTGLVVAMWCVMLGAGVADAILRVGSGDHFLSDVVSGAAVGAGVGILVPWLHKRRGIVVLPTVTADGAGVSVAARF